MEIERGGQVRFGIQEAGAHRFIVDPEVFQGGIDLEAARTNGGGACRRESARAAGQIGCFGGLPKRQKARDAKTRDATVIAIGGRAKGTVDLAGEFGEVERIVAGGFDGAGIDDDDFVSGGVRGELGAAGFLAGFVAVKPVDHRVAFL